MPHRTRAFALRAAACIAAALVVAGCSPGGSGSSSSSSAVTVSGHMLRIHISDPGYLRSDPVAQDVVRAEQLAFRAQRGEVKDFKLALVLDRQLKPSDNARSAIGDSAAIAYLGEVAPGDSDATAGITNAADLLQISPTDTALELSQSTSVVRGAPDSYFQSFSTYGHTFARMVPSSLVEAQALVAEMKSLGISKLYVGHDASDYGRALALAVTAAARTTGIARSANIGAADGIFYGSDSPSQAVAFFSRAGRSAPAATLFAPSSLDGASLTSALTSGTHNLYVTIPGFMPAQLSAAGKRFQQSFLAAYHHPASTQAIFGYGAMSALLAVLKQAGSTANDRATVVKDFLAFTTSHSVLGAYRIDHAGETSLRAFVLARLRNGRLIPFKAASHQ